MARQRAIVVGGSLGGLFAAHMLRLAGLDVKVYERSGDDLATRGAGIGTHDEMLAVVRRIGIPIDHSIGVDVRTRIVLDTAGYVTHALALGRVMSAWAHIYTPLKELLPQDKYHFNMALQRIEQDSSGVTALFADGSRAHADLLVAADGIRSTVREQLMPHVQPTYAGYVAWRGVVQESEFPPALHAAIFERHLYCLPKREMMLGYMVPGRDNEVRPGKRAYNWVWYRPASEHDELTKLCTDASGHRHGVAIPPPLIRPECIREMRVAADTLLAPQMKHVVRLTAHPFFQGIFDLESPRLVQGRAALLGDAAFVARPHVGMGVTKAALDAQFLADAIVAAGGDLDAALIRYDEARRLFGQRVVRRARMLGAHLEAKARTAAPARDEDPYERPEVVLRECGANLSDIPELAELT
jgi:2-polyprenyl-6-methoxyphenol hydroxylase-like FAD-dependent oxidoreductase